MRPTDRAPDFDPAAFDLTKIHADLEAIRAINPHRYEFEMLTAVVHVDTAKHLVAGYKDLTEKDFWTKAHMPGFPLMPGVLMLEAAAQLMGYYTVSEGFVKDVLMGLGGIDGAKFKRMVRPGDRLVIIGRGIKVDRRLTRFFLQGFVGSEFVFEATVTGVPLKLTESGR